MYIKLATGNQNLIRLEFCDTLWKPEFWSQFVEKTSNPKSLMYEEAQSLSLSSHSNCLTGAEVNDQKNSVKILLNST